MVDRLRSSFEIAALIIAPSNFRGAAFDALHKQVRGRRRDRRFIDSVFSAVEFFPPSSTRPPFPRPPPPGLYPTCSLLSVAPATSRTQLSNVFRSLTFRSTRKTKSGKLAVIARTQFCVRDRPDFEAQQKVASPLISVNPITVIFSSLPSEFEWKTRKRDSGRSDFIFRLCRCYLRLFTNSRTTLFSLFSSFRATIFALLQREIEISRYVRRQLGDRSRISFFSIIRRCSRTANLIALLLHRSEAPYGLSLARITIRHYKEDLA